MNAKKLQILMVTSQYPTAERPHGVPFIARQVAFLRKAGVEVDVFHFSGKKNPLNYLRAWAQLRKFVKGKTYDVLHAQWGQSAVLALPKRMPWIITFRGDDLEGIAGKHGKPTILGRGLMAVSKLMARMADQVVVVSESLARQLPRRDYNVLPSGIDFDLFRPINQLEARAKLGLAADKPLILFAATTVENPRKRLPLARAAVGLVRANRNVEMVVATHVSHDQIADYMSACDVLLLTSVHEGSPNVVKEALACNLAVVSVDVGDVRERLNGIDGCYVCENESPEAVADALEKALSKPGRIDGRTKVSHLDERVISRNLISLYEKTIRRYHATKETGKTGTRRKVPSHT